jgi:hypothetical protein
MSRFMCSLGLILGFVFCFRFSAMVSVWVKLGLD